MSHDDLPLFAWVPPRKIIPFPARLRTGHARKVAVQLSKARTNREADHVLTRAVETFCRHLETAGVPDAEIDMERVAYLKAIDHECNKVNASWRPVVSPASETPGGAA
jgi:hypothetical protein